VSGIGRNGARVVVLVTGATGFLGRAVVKLLAEHGHKVKIVHRSTSDLSPIRAFVAGAVVADVTDPLAMTQAAEGTDAVIHLAADLSHWRAHRERIMRTNVMGTRIVAEAGKTAGVPLLVHVSSIAAVGYAQNGAPIDENAPNNFVPLRLVYHESKRLAEEEALDARRYGVRVVIVNPGVVYGPRPLSHPFGHTMLEIARGKIPGHPSGGISVVDVDDVAGGIVAALERGADGERYILAGDNVTYGNIFAKQAAAAGVRYRGRTIPAPVLHAAARSFELRARLRGGAEPRLTIDHAKLAPLHQWYTSAKAQRALGFRSRPLEATLERMAASYRDAGALPART
jgi:dihydroflavonol-4-reductase